MNSIPYVSHPGAAMVKFQRYLKAMNGKVQGTTGLLVKVDQFLEQVTQWASAQADILALALVGSHARGAAMETSDVDLVIIAADPNHYLENTDWVRRYGTVEKQQVEGYGPLTSLRIWYRDGLEVEYGLTDERWAAVPLDEGTRQVIAGGMRVLFERSDTLSRHLTIVRPFHDGRLWAGGRGT